jgi:hypothetical protein
MPVDAAPRRPRKSARQLARGVDDGRFVAEALRYLHVNGAEPDAKLVAEALARFLVARCESHHAGWRVVRQVVVETSAEVPWEKCARRAIPLVADDLLDVSEDEGRTPLHRAQHLAARHRAEEIAPYLDQLAIFKQLGLELEPVGDEHWRGALSGAVVARSREQVARALERALRD